MLIAKGILAKRVTRAIDSDIKLFAVTLPQSLRSKFCLDGRPRILALLAARIAQTKLC